MRKKLINETKLIKFPTEAEALEYVKENELDVKPYKRGDDWVIEESLVEEDFKESCKTAEDFVVEYSRKFNDEYHAKETLEDDGYDVVDYDSDYLVVRVNGKTINLSLVPYRGGVRLEESVETTNESLDEIRQNFYNVLECAYEDYYAQGKGTDISAICLGKLEESVDNFELVESLLTACDSLLFEGLNEDGTNVFDAKIVQERKGKGISVMVNGTEYRYVSPTMSTDELFRKFTKQLSFAKSGFKALNWLKKNALCYYGCKNPEGGELVGVDESVVNEAVKVQKTKYNLPSGKPMLFIDNEKTGITLSMDKDEDSEVLFITCDTVQYNHGESCFVDYEYSKESKMISDFNKMAKDIAEYITIKEFWDKWRHLDWQEG